MDRFPEEIPEILRLCGGVKVAGVVDIDFGLFRSFGFAELLPATSTIMEDGFGNFWCIDINAEMGHWGPVLYVCHDPPVIWKEASDLHAFLDRFTVADSPEVFVRSHEDYIQAWFTIGPGSVCLRRSGESLMRTLPPGSKATIDFTTLDPGSGFWWASSGAELVAKRVSAEPVFEVFASEGVA